MNKSIFAMLCFFPVLACADDERPASDTATTEQPAQRYHTPRERLRFSLALSWN